MTFDLQVPIMIRRLHELQSKEAKTPRDLTQVSPVSGMEGVESGGEEGEVSGSSRTGSKVKPPPCPAQKNGSTRLLPDFVFQARSSRETEDRQEGRGGGRRRAVMEYGRKAKQKLKYSSSSCRKGEEEEEKREEEEEEEGERCDSSDFPAGSSGSWSEMSSMVIGSDYCLSPLSPPTEQRLILQYLTPLGEYQEVKFSNSSLFSCPAHSFLLLFLLALYSSSKRFPPLPLPSYFSANQAARCMLGSAASSGRSCFSLASIKCLICSVNTRVSYIHV